MAKDPVCGMQVDEANARWKSDYLGTTYSFCGPGCKQAFDRNPAKYAEGSSQHAHAGHGDHSH